MVGLAFFFVGSMTYNQIHTTGLIDPTSIIKDLITLWLGVQALVAHKSNPDGSKANKSEKTSKDSTDSGDTSEEDEEPERN